MVIDQCQKNISRSHELYMEKGRLSSDFNLDLASKIKELLILPKPCRFLLLDPNTL